jgi:hypothetical protein
VVDKVEIMAVVLVQADIVFVQNVAKKFLISKELNALH